MEKITILTGLLLFISQWATAQLTPPVGVILDKYIEVIGGKEALMKVTDLTMTMSADRNGTSLMITFKQKLPNKFSMVVQANGSDVMKQIGDGSKVVRTVIEGNSTLSDAEAKLATLMNMLLPEVHYAENRVKNHVVGTQRVGENDTYKLIHTTADGAITWADNFDELTGLKIQSAFTHKSPQGEITVTTIYSDYKDVNGIKFPMTLRQQSGQDSMTMSVEEVTVNSGLNDSNFTINN